MDERIISLRHELHAHPELSGREEETRRRIHTFISRNTAFECLKEGPFLCYVRKAAGHAEKPGIAFRADFDALPIPEETGLPYRSRVPGLSHACGHDGHAAALCGLALSLEGKDLPRDVCLIFQPAEETGQGGEACAAFLKDLPVSEVYAFHNRPGYPLGAIAVREGLSQCASMGLTVRFTGMTSHASEPEKGKNPASALAALTTFSQSPDPSLYAGQVWCAVIGLALGNRNFGISPGEGEVSFTLRAQEEADLDLLEKQLRERALDLAARSGLRATFSLSDPFPETRNDPACAGRVREAASRLGLACLAMEEPWRASEDFGWYTKVLPGAIFYIGCGEDHPALHTGGYDFPDEVLDTAAALFRALIEEGSEDS